MRLRLNCPDRVEPVVAVMDAPCPFDRRCDECPMSDYACRCLKVSEEVVREAVLVFGVRTVAELRERTGAGDGCNACHRRLRTLLEQLAAAREKWSLELVG